MKNELLISPSTYFHHENRLILTFHMHTPIPQKKKTTNPTQDSTNPTQDSTNPTQDSTNPTQDSTNPTQDSTKPTQDSTKPTQDLHDIQFMLCELQKFLHRGLSMRDYAGPACDMVKNGSLWSFNDRFVLFENNMRR